MSLHGGMKKVTFTVKTVVSDMQLRALRIFLIAVSSLFMMVSCRSHRDVASDGYKKQYFGIKMTEDDNRDLYREIESWIGVPYRYGGSTRNGVDCSGFVSSVYQSVYGKKLQRSSELIYKKNCNKIKKSKLDEGDLVFFKTGRKKRIGHVGIYLKNGKFAHASSSRGVIVSSLEDDYYKSHFLQAGRVK